MWEEQQLPKLQLYLSLPNRDLATPEQRAAWEEFYAMSVASAFASVWRVRAARPLWEDVTQDVLAKLIKYVPGFQLDPARGDLESCVKAIALHEAWRWARKRVKRRECPFDPELADQMLDPEPSADAELERTQEHELFKARVAEFTARLSERDRQIVVKRFLDHHSVPKIARDLYLTEGCVESVLHRVLPELREFLRTCDLGLP